MNKTWKIILVICLVLIVGAAKGPVVYVWRFITGIFTILPAEYELPARLPSVPPDTAQSANFSKHLLTQEYLSQLGQCSALEELNVSYTQLEDAWLKEISALPKLKTLDLSNTNVTDQGVKFLSKQITGIELLNLQFDRKVTDDSLLYLGSLKSLVSLNLAYDKQITDDGLAQALSTEGAFRNLRAIDLRCCNISDKGAALLPKMPNLESLVLSTTKVTDDGVEKILQLKKLKNLSLYGTRISSASLQMLSLLPNLEQLDLQCINIPELEFAALKNLSGLRSLLLDGRCCDRKRKKLDAMAEPISKLTHLKVLSVYDCAVGDQGIKKLNSIRGLEELNLSFTPVTDAGMRYVAEFPHLKKLNVSTLILPPDAAPSKVPLGISDLGFGYLGNLRSLQELNASQSLITDWGLKALSNLKDLRVLDLSWDKISDRGLSQLNSLEKLEKLKLADTQVTGSGIRELTRLSKLKILDLTSTNIEDRHLAYLQNFPALEELWLNADAGVSEHGLQHLRNCRNLRYLNLGYTKITAKAAQDLQEYLPYCRITGGARRGD